MIGAIAARQYGVVPREELLRAGVGRRAIEERVREGRLHVVHLGVYAAGHPLLTRHGRWKAAALAGGPNAVLSHRTAAAILELLPSHRLELTVPTARRRNGITIHRSLLADDEITSVHGI